MALGDASLSMLRIVPIWERLKPILEATPEIDSSKVHPGTLSGAIDISHLSFRYSADGPWILKDVSIKIKPGEFVARVGDNAVFATCTGLVLIWLAVANSMNFPQRRVAAATQSV